MITDLERITAMFADAGVPYEVEEGLGLFDGLTIITSEGRNGRGRPLGYPGFVALLAFDADGKLYDVGGM